LLVRFIAHASEALWNICGKTTYRRKPKNFEEELAPVSLFLQVPHGFPWA
jgi:hypothetical protein